MNVSERKFWSSYKIITVWCIQIIYFLLLVCDIMVVYLLFLDLYKTFLPCFLIGEVNTISIYFLKNNASFQSKCNLKLDHMFDSMVIEHRFVKRKYSYWPYYILKIIYQELVFVPILIKYNTQPRTWHLILKMGAPDLFWMEELDTQANLCEEYFLASIHQKLQWIRHNEKNMWRNWNQQLHQFLKVQYIIIEDLLNCAPMFLWRRFAVHKIRPLKW